MDKPGKTAGAYVQTAWPIIFPVRSGSSLSCLPGVVFVVWVGRVK